MGRTEGGGEAASEKRATNFVRIGGITWYAITPLIAITAEENGGRL